MWITFFSFCSTPVTLISRAPITSGTVLLELARPDHGVGDGRLVFQSHENRIAGARPLPHQHDPADGHAPPWNKGREEARAARYRARRDRGAGTTPDALSATEQVTIVLDHLFARQHGRQVRRPAPAPACSRARTAAGCPCRRFSESFTAQNASRRLRPTELKVSACASFSIALGGKPVRSQSAERNRSRCRAGLDLFCPVFRKSADLAKAETHGASSVLMSPLIEAWRACKHAIRHRRALQRAIPIG